MSVEESDKNIKQTSHERKRIYQTQ